MFTIVDDAMTAKHILIDLYDPFKRGHTSGNPIKWECVQTFRKLTVVSATTFIIHPIGKLYTVLGLLSVFFLHHLHVRPYADDRLNFAESFSLVLLCVMTSVNLFWAHVFMSNEMNIPDFYTLANVFLHFEVVVVVLPVVVVVVVVVVQILRKMVHIYSNRTAKQDD